MRSRGRRLVGEPLGGTRKKRRRKDAQGLMGAKSFVLGSWDLPGDHGAGLRMAGGGGGGTELREAAVARLQAGHGAPAEGEQGWGEKDMRGGRLHRWVTKATQLNKQHQCHRSLPATS